MLLNQVKNAVRDVVGMFSFGFYHAKAGAARTFRRVSADAEWGASLPFVRRIDNPILDVVPPEGARLAIVSQDAMPEFPAYVGVVSDDQNAPEGMTVWLRADLQQHEGVVELGATKSVRIKVGSNDVDISPGEDGSVEIKTAGGGLTIDSQGKIALGTQTVNLLKQVSDLAGLVEALNTNLSTAVCAPGGPLSTSALHATDAIAAAAVGTSVDSITKG
ncbi:MAG: hypothetical protein ACF8MF_06770 [Phycisphaerales bacterium JB052]